MADNYDIGGWTIIVIVLVVFLIIIGILVYFSFSRQAAETTRFCGPDLCAVSIINGTKRCPEITGGQVERDNALEYCSSRNFCQNPRFPCALQANGSTDCTGQCNTNDDCACIDNVLCAPFISSYFIRARKQDGSLDYITQASTYQDAFGDGSFTSGGAINLGSFKNPIGTCTISEVELPLMDPPQCRIGKLANIKNTNQYACIYADEECTLPAVITVDTDGTVTCEIP